MDDEILVTKSESELLSDILEFAEDSGFLESDLSEQERNDYLALKDKFGEEDV